ncbi:MAG: glycosyltransferase family 2 protein [Candidatus Aureabacteria bacterium]|nr:glycosyltransferase family 2 protein [Candidatus Auribacterota bacterium]
MDTTPAQPLVYIVLLDYDGRDDTVECLESLRRLDYGNFKILLIDNGSKRSCMEEVRGRFPHVLTRRIEPNRGFMGGCNVGIREALDAGAKYVWLLNNDTVVEPSALSALVREAEADPRCGILGSKIFYYGEREILQHAGGALDLETGRLSHLGFLCRDEGRFDRVEEVFYVTGCSMLARAAMIREVGLMEEIYVFYFDDIDWCVRARRKGWGVKYVPGSVLYHKLSTVAGGIRSPAYVYAYSRSYLLFFLLNYPALFPRALLSWWVRDFPLRFLRERNAANVAASCRGLAGMVAVAPRLAWRALGRRATLPEDYPSPRHRNTLTAL